ncbi:MAG: DUF21 domain-containing protein [Lentisphaerae bacterium]|nr:DUF21 domain-containing protein [Lentisphaerota bacterium]
MIVALQIALLLACLAGSAFFSGIETGIIAINRLRLMHQARNGSAAAGIIEGYLRQTDRLLGTTLVGNNLVNVMLATVAAAIGEAQGGAVGQMVSGVLIALAVLICGEYLPKAWFTSRPLERCLPFAHLLQLAEQLLKPLASFCMFLTQWATVGAGNGRRTQFVTREHLHLLTRDSEAGGQISTFERLMISRVLDMQVKTAGDIMTPLAKVARVDEQATIADAIACVRTRGHMKIPVFTTGGARCLGIVYMQDVLAKLPGPEQDPVIRHMKPAFFLQATVRADDVLPLLRRHRQHIALIRDAQQQVCGIVTIENVLKILVGNLPSTASGERKAEPAPAIVAHQPPPTDRPMEAG